MLEALEIVKGAVSTKDLVPVLTHFAFHEGRIHGFNGRVHISAPAPEMAEHSFTLPAVPFLAAWNAQAKLSLTKDHATITHGKLRVRLPIGPVEQFPFPTLTGKPRKLKGPWLPVLRVLRPFVGEDASRPWCAGILMNDTQAYATNNIAFVDATLPSAMPQRFVLPVYAVEELLRIGLEPQSLVVESNAVTLRLPGEVWLRAQLLEDGWPDAAPMLQSAFKGVKWKSIPSALADAVAELRPFCPNPTNPVVKFNGDQIQTQDGAMSAVIGGFEGTPLGECAFHADHLARVLSVAEAADWSRFPRVPFKGCAEDVPLRGVVAGVLE